MPEVVSLRYRIQGIPHYKEENIVKILEAVKKYQVLKLKHGSQHMRLVNGLKCETHIKPASELHT